MKLRDGAHHSGNWGGLLRNPGIVLANAIASMVDASGKILIEGLRPPPIPDSVVRALKDVEVGGNPGEPDVDTDYGEPGLTPAERVFGWNNIEVLAFKAGNPDKPVNAIPHAAFAHMQIRFVVGTKYRELQQIVRAHLDAHGFPMVDVEVERGMPATRVDPDNPWVQWALQSLTQTTGTQPVLLPNLGGTLPNDVFADVLGMPHAMGAAFVSRLLAAYARRASAGTGRIGRSAHHGGPVLGSRRARRRCVRDQSRPPSSTQNELRPWP